MFGLGLIALFAWFTELVPFLKGCLVCALLLGGVVGIVVGLAKLRARRTFAKAAHDKPSQAETKSEA